MNHRSNVGYENSAQGLGSLYVFVLLFLIAIDFRSATALEGQITGLLGAATWIVLLAYVLRFSMVSRIAVQLLLPFFILTIVGVLRSIYFGESFRDLVSTSLPFVLFMAGILISTNVLKDSAKGLDSYGLLNVLFIFCLVSSIFTLGRAIFFLDSSFSGTRYYTIPTSAILGFGLSLGCLYSGIYRGQSLLLMLFLCVCLSLSVTRTYLPIFGIMMVLGLLLQSLRTQVRGTISILFGAIILIAFLVTYSPDLVSEWVARLAPANDIRGTDISLVTRAAEIDFQISKLSENSFNFIFGLGLAGKTAFTDEYYNMLVGIYSLDYSYQGRGIGHNTFIGLMYVGGVPLGLWCIGALVRVGIGAYTTAYFLMRKNLLDSTDEALIVMGTTGTLGYLAYALLGGLFGDRQMSFSLGLAIGVGLALQKKFNSKPHR